MSVRRLTLEAADGRMVVRDLGHPGARLIDIHLPSGGRVMVAEHLCGWCEAAGEDGAPPLWPTVDAAVEALTGRTRDGEPWFAVLEEFGSALAQAPAAPLPREEEQELSALAARCPGCYVDGPRPDGTGGWYMFIGGLPGGRWVMERGDSPLDAAHGALDRAAEIVDRS